MIHDAPRFLAALESWGPVIASDPELAVPREIKRFKNKARYYAMRLTQQREPRGWTRSSRTAELRIREDSLVALAALSYVRPEWLSDPEIRGRLLAATSDIEEFVRAKLTALDAADEASVVEAVRRAVRTHCERRVGDGDSESDIATPEEIELFLSVVGEVAFSGERADAFTKAPDVAAEEA